VLTISAAASDAIRDLVAASDLPEGSGMRISGPAQGTTTFHLSLVEEAPASDEVVEERGVTVFLDDEAAQLLDDKTLDAQASGGQVAFSIKDA
jgi:Fe-S cluster assembly iron-binding protein IscA